MRFGKRYSPEVFSYKSVPELAGPHALPKSPFVAIFMPDYQGFHDAEIWRRLLTTHFGNTFPHLFFVRGASGLLEAKNLFPASLHRKLHALEKFPFLGVGHDLSRTFAAIVNQNKDRSATITLAMVGPPTEEAWDQFEAAWVNLNDQSK